MVALEYLQQPVFSKTGLIDMFKIKTEAPKNKTEQFRIINKIESVIGEKISLPGGKKKKTRTGKPKHPTTPPTTTPGESV